MGVQGSMGFRVLGAITLRVQGLKQMGFWTLNTMI